MDCIQSIRKAIDYMENHLLEHITYENVARHVHMSNYHFHRMFRMITGITANEYIRNRRLSMAGQELVLSDKKVIDIALKYGYETPESFAKAFQRFHGVTPAMAKQPGVQLKSFNRLTIKIQFEGGTVMDYQIVQKEKFCLLAKVESFQNESIAEEGNQDIPDFWERCGAEGVFDILREHTNIHDIYGVCAPVSETSNYFEYGIGMFYEGGKVPEGFRVWEVTSTLWAVFKCIGTDGSCIGETWNRIFKEFLPGSEYEMLDADDFELYSDKNGDCFCEIWIPAQRK